MKAPIGISVLIDFLKPALESAIAIQAADMCATVNAVSTYTAILELLQRAEVPEGEEQVREWWILELKSCG